MHKTREQLLQDLQVKLEEMAIADTLISKVIDTLANASIRPVRVIWECITNGEVSTEKLQQVYGYNQPPRAARDVRELGFPLVTTTGITEDGRRMAIYKIGDITEFEQKTGRKIFSKKEKELLISINGAKCFFCKQDLLPNELQIDHRVPFEVAGNNEHDKTGTDALILLCNSCNRSKSWSCEQCQNFQDKVIKICKTCYWCDPDCYDHVRTELKRVVNFSFDSTELDLSKFAHMNNTHMRNMILKFLKEI